MRIEFEKEKEKEKPKQDLIPPHKVIKKRKGRHGKNYIFEGKIVSHFEFWELKIRYFIKEQKDLFITSRFNPNDIKKILILMKVWEAKTPTDLFKILIEQNYGLLQTKKILEKQSKNEEKS